MLWRALKHVEHGFYIDVGAWSPDIDSVTRAFYEHGWSGINVEPNPEFNRQLKDRRPNDINLQLATGEREGSSVMNFLSNPGLSTLDDAIAGEHKESGWEADRQEVQITTLSLIWKEYVQPGQEVHFLKVDVEGFEEATLAGNDWKENRPWVVVVEATKPMSQEESYASWEPILLNARYHFAYADGLNRFYVAEEHGELLSPFKYPPNVFDEFVLSGQVEAENRASSAGTRVAALEQECVVGAKAKAELTAILNSRSWKVTAPLRWLVSGIKKLKPRGKNVIRYFVGEFVYIGMRVFPPQSWIRRGLVSMLSRFPVFKEKLRGLALKRRSSVNIFGKRITEPESLSPAAKRYYRILQSGQKKGNCGRNR